jgi:hyperosmotically inducible protein
VSRAMDVAVGRLGNWTRKDGRRNQTMSMRSFTAIAAVLVAIVTLAGCQTMTGKSAGTVVDDASITAAVKSKLVADKAANLTRVDVDTNNGRVSLNGVVDTAAQKAKAEQFAWETKGVKGVVNNLQVSKP